MVIRAWAQDDRSTAPIGWTGPLAWCGDCERAFAVSKGIVDLGVRWWLSRHRNALWWGLPECRR